MHGGHIVLKIVVNMMKCDVCIGLTFLFEHRHLTNVSLLLLGLSFFSYPIPCVLRMLISSTGKFQNIEKTAPKSKVRNIRGKKIFQECEKTPVHCLNYTIKATV